MHFRKHRGKGLDIYRKIDRDNAGKGLLSAGACSNLQRLSTQSVEAEVIRDNRSGA